MLNPQSTGSLTYLVTGGAGFIGSHLVDALLTEGHRVIVIDDFSTGRPENLAQSKTHPNLTFAEHRSIMDGTMEEYAQQAHVIIHLAAVVGVDIVIGDPLKTIRINALGTERVLHTALDGRKCRRVLIASSAEVYGKGAQIPFVETDDLILGVPTTPRASYAASKILAESLAFAYHSTYHERTHSPHQGPEVIVCRLFNIAGPRQTDRYVIPRFVRNALAGKRLEVYGDGSQTRCFCDVRDAVNAIIGLSRHPDAGGQVYNIGHSEETPIHFLATAVKVLTRSRSQIVNTGLTSIRGGQDVGRRVPDIQQLQTLLNWKPKYSLDDILQNVIAYEQSLA